jgi:deoxycytidylate deaminase
MIINAGIKEVVMRTVYPDDFGVRLLREAGVRLKKVTDLQHY